MPTVMSPAPKAQKLKDQAKEEDKEEDTEEAPEKSTSVPPIAMCEIGRDGSAVTLTGEQPQDKALRPAGIVDRRADAEEHQGCQADDRPFGQFDF
jgi:hypothetical protein